MFYVYQYHVNGSLVVLPHEIVDTYCDICLDSDKLIGEFETQKEATEFIDRIYLNEKNL